MLSLFLSLYHFLPSSRNNLRKQFEIFLNWNLISYLYSTSLSFFLYLSFSYCNFVKFLEEYLWHVVVLYEIFVLFVIVFALVNVCLRTCLDFVISKYSLTHTHTHAEDRTMSIHSTCCLLSCCAVINNKIEISVATVHLIDLKDGNLKSISNEIYCHVNYY